MLPAIVVGVIVASRAVVTVGAGMVVLPATTAGALATPDASVGAGKVVLAETTVGLTVTLPPAWTPGVGIVVVPAMTAGAGE